MSLSFTDKVKAAKNGDSAAFASIYAAVYKELYHIALCNLRNEHDAADAVSDAVLDAFTSIGRLRDEEAFKAWIVRILMAKIKTRQRGYIEANNARDFEAVEQELTKEMQYDGLEIVEAMGILDETERLLLSLNAVAGYTSDEIAKLCKANPSTVRSKLFRAKIKLKERLSDSGMS